METITYEPRKIIEYVKEAGHLTSFDLETQFEYDPFSAGVIILNLKGMGILRTGEPAYVTQGTNHLAAFYLTEEGMDTMRWPERREHVMEDLSVLPGVAIDVFNNLMPIFKAKGMSLDEVLDAIDSGDLDDLIRRERIETVSSLSPDDIRRFGEELRKIFE